MQLQAKKPKHDGFDRKKILQQVEKESKFITDLFTFSMLQTQQRFEGSSDEEEEDENKNRSKMGQPNFKGPSRAKSLTELQQRLETITSKKKLTYKEKMVKKGLKSRLKKRNKQDKRQLSKSTEIKSENSKDKDFVKTAKPVFNSEGKMVFSKFDFSNLGSKKGKKQETDPKKLLKNLKRQEETIKQLKESGETEKAVEIKEKADWRNAMAKASGEKVKDDPLLLKKTLKKKEQKQKSSKKKWEARKEGTMKSIEEKQKKRTENIEKRKKGNKLSKLKKASKRGKIIPGF